MSRNRTTGYLKLISLVMLVFILFGCSTKENIVIQTKHEYVTYELPKEILTSCKPQRPMSNEKYSKLNLEEREVYLSNYIITLMGELKKCDNKIRNIEDFVSKNNQLYKDRNDGERKTKQFVRKTNN